MKQFPFVADQEAVLTNAEDSSSPLPKGQKISHYQFLLGRLTVEAFTAKHTGLDALCLVTTTRIELENQRDAAKERGYWLLEDERADALLRAVEQGPYNHNFAIALVTFAKETAKMKDYKPQ